MTENSNRTERGPVVWPLDHGIPWPWSTHHVSLTAASGFPTHAKDLVGWRVRLVRGGEAVEADVDPHRLNLLVNEQGEILDLIVG